jgi:hypothetical protein
LWGFDRPQRLWVRIERILERLWWREVDGEHLIGLRGSSDGDRIIVSTSRGLSVFESTGVLAWRQLGLVFKGEAPDGTLVTSRRAQDFIRLSPGGEVLVCRVLEGPWEVVGWNDDSSPRLAGAEGFPWGTLWIEGLGYSLADGFLECFARDGRLRSSTPIAAEPFRAKLAEVGPPWAAEAPEEFLERFASPARLHVQEYDSYRRRFIAASMSIPAFVATIAIDDQVLWVAIPSVGCCNSIRVLPNGIIAHLSSCGKQLSLLSASGEVISRRQFQSNPAGFFFSGERGFGVALGDQGLQSFDMTGEPLWALALPRVGGAAVRGNVLYTVNTTTDGTLEVAAFRLGNDG